MKVAIHQPNYLPWSGYFAKLAAADVFVFLDDVQFPQGRSYVYRTKVGDARGAVWLSAPVSRSSGSLINEAAFADPDWSATHLRKLRSAYAGAPHFDEVVSLMESVYAEGVDNLAALNMLAVRRIADYLDLDRRFEMSSSVGSEGVSDDRLISIVQRLGGSCYVSGKGGQNYQDPAKFEAAGLELEVRVYEPHPYPQTHFQEFEPGLSIVDALFSLGRDARRLLG